jgi:hypothetical protein
VGTILRDKSAILTVSSLVPESLQIKENSLSLLIINRDEVAPVLSVLSMGRSEEHSKPQRRSSNNALRLFRRGGMRNPGEESLPRSTDLDSIDLDCDHR